MVRLRVVAAAVAAVLAVVALAAPAPAPAHEETVGDITLVHPRSRPAAQGHNGVVYLDIVNRGAADDRLVAVSAPIADRVEIHLSTMKDGIHRMRKVESIVVPAGGKAVLAPGGYHLMLVGLKFMLMAEETIPLTLSFERAGDITASVAVEDQGSTASDSSDSGHGEHQAKDH